MFNTFSLTSVSGIEKHFPDELKNKFGDVFQEGLGCCTKSKAILISLDLSMDSVILYLLTLTGNGHVAERISNHYLVRELFWPLEFRIYIFRPMRMTDAILPGSPLTGNIKGRANHSRPLFASSLASSGTDHPFPLSSQSSPLSIMRREHPIYGPLVSGKSFFYHSSLLLNQRILGETNWIFSTPAFQFLS